MPTLNPIKPRSARRINRKEVLTLAERGLNSAQIAKHQGVAQSTVWRFLEASKPEQLALKRFKENRADVFATFQANNLDLQNRLVESLKQDRVFDALKPSEKTGLLDVLNRSTGTLYDKERLETGKSTSNVSTVSRMLDSVAESMHKPQRVEKTEKSASQEVALPR